MTGECPNCGSEVERVLQRDESGEVEEIDLLDGSTGVTVEAFCSSDDCRLGRHGATLWREVSRQSRLETFDV